MIYKLVVIDLNVPDNIRQGWITTDTHKQGASLHAYGYRMILLQ